MSRMIIILGLLSLASSIYCYSSGAPDTVCDDMTPKHPFDAQKSKIPYTVKVSQTSLKPESVIDITISGKKFKGFLIQVRGDNKAVGSFQIDSSDKNSKALKCHGTANSAATHKNGSEKSSVVLKWKAPKSKGEYTVYATVAADGSEFWAKSEVAKITVN